MPLTNGETLGHYRILSPIGEGGMGEVYSAFDTRLSREVAIKVLPLGGDSPPDQRRQFLREARTASALNHPNIVTIHEIASDRGVDFIVMELVRGASLRDLIHDGGVPLEEAVNYVAQAADALDKAHRAGIVHRDVKPANILVSEDNLAKVLDFGIAKLARSSGDLHTFGAFDAPDATITVNEPLTGSTLSGTVSYMSPEQASGREVDARSDIFSLGVVAYELFSLRRPFQGATTLAVLQQICLEDPPRLSSLVPGIPEHVDEAIWTALRKDPAARHQSMLAFAREIRGAGPATSYAVNPFRAGHAARRPWYVQPKTVFPAAILALALLGVFLTQFGLFSLNDGSNTPKAAAVDPPRAYLDGRELLVRYDKPQNIDHAIELFQAAAQADASYASAHTGLAEAFAEKYRATGDKQWLTQAAEHAEKAHSLNPHLAASHLSLALVARLSGRKDDAIASLRHVLSLDPNNAEALRQYAAALNSAGQSAEAERNMRLSAKLAPRDWRSHLDLGTLRFSQGDYRDALSSFERALELAPDSALAYRNAAAAHHMLKQWREAAAALQRSLEIQPTASGYSNLGTLLYFQGRYKEAVDVFEKAAQLRPEGYIFWGNLADAYRWTPELSSKAPSCYERAIKLLRQNLSKQSADPNLQATLAMYLAKAGDRTSALSEIAKVPQSEKRPGVLYKVALTLEIAGDRPAALRALSSGISNGLSLYEVQNEPELAQLRTDSRFARLAATSSTPPSR